MKKSDVYLTGDDVKVDYIVDGNLFILAYKLALFEYKILLLF